MAQFSTLDAPQVIRSVFDETSGGLTSSNFLSKAVGRKVVVTYPTSTTEVYSYQEGSTVMYALTVTYTDSTKANISSVERTS